MPRGRARALWAAARARAWPESYALVSLEPSRLAAAAALIGGSAGRFAALVLERDEVSLTVEESLWRASDLRAHRLSESGPWRAITLDLDVDLDVSGFLAPAATRLGAAGVSVVPQCAYKKDHLLVRAADLPLAIDVLAQLCADCA